MKKFRLHRRHFLKGSGAMIALPILECMLGPNGKAFAMNNMPIPKRFGVYFFGNGVPIADWVPQQIGADWSLSECLSPLEPVKSYCNILSGFDVLAAGMQPHHGGQAGILSGLPYLEIPSDSEHFASKYRGPSIDQIIAQELQTTSLELGVSKLIPQDRGQTLRAISHESANTPLPPLLNPAEVYELLFSNFVTPVAPHNSLRTHILDVVKEDINALKMKLGTQDKQRLDEHLTNISEMRQRILDLPPEYLNSCVPIESVTTQNEDVASLEPLETINQLMCDLWVMAWSCGLNRITTMMFNAGISETVFHPVSGVSEGHYAMTQNLGENGQEDLLRSITTFTVSQFNYLVEKMANTVEGDGTLLDNSLLMLTSGHSDVQGPHATDYPVVLVGGCGGAVKTPGMHHRNVGANTNDILVSILLAMDTGRDSIGEENSLSNTPIYEILN